MEKKKRRYFPDEFKRQAVERVETSGLPLFEVAAELGVHESQLRRWARQFGQTGALRAHRPVDAPIWSARPGGNPAKDAHDRQPSRPSDRAGQAPAELHGDRAKPNPPLAVKGLADLTYVRTGEGWLFLAAIPRREYPPSLRERMIGSADHYVHPQDRRLEYARNAPYRGRPRGSGNGHPPPETGARSHPS